MTAAIEHPDHPVYDQAECNSLIRKSDTGKIDLKYFENYIMKPDNNVVRFKQQWFVGLFDSSCESEKCTQMVDNFEQLYLIWLGETMNKKGIDYENEESWINDENNTSLETFKIAQVDCSQYKDSICKRILPT